MSHYFQQEEETLRVIQNIDHPHLIKPIASYQYHNHEDGSFLFPWAERGNLKEFWKTEKTRPLKSPEMMAWMLKQMCGLCHALSVLHNEHRRHGDIKPENILLFEEGDYNGTLRIADVGLAKFHPEATERRIDLKEITKTMTGTTRYLSPEFVQENQILRVFDVWALGCVFIEFLIWTLHGYDRLFEFRKASCAHFWDEVNGSFVIHAEVRTWISNISQILRGSETALESLFDLVELHMLVPNYKLRSPSIDVYKALVAICHGAESDSRYLIDPDVESRARNNPPRSSRESPQNLTIPVMPGSRIAPLPQKQGSFEIRVEGPDDGVDNTSLMVHRDGKRRADPKTHAIDDHLPKSSIAIDASTLEQIEAGVVGMFDTEAAAMPVADVHHKAMAAMHFDEGSCGDSPSMAYSPHSNVSPGPGSQTSRKERGVIAAQVSYRTFVSRPLP
ncbi:hypothetical protein NW767_015144 [Fusarium falciforme]|nr:hypothetical protein NW767_015144 [Fusarium falciforme]